MLQNAFKFYHYYVPPNARQIQVCRQRHHAIISLRQNVDIQSKAKNAPSNCSLRAVRPYYLLQEEYSSALILIHMARKDTHSKPIHAFIDSRACNSTAVHNRPTPIL
jgi:hypothetical protein